jgi:Na+/H+-dicarboxylate symporter
VPGSAYASQFLEPIGTLWVNAIRMTVLPMVISLLVVSIGGAGQTKAIGRMGRNAILVCLAMLVGAAIIVVIVVPPLLSILPLSDASVQAVRASVSQEATAQLPPMGFAAWLTGLIPSNPIKAASDGALLQLVIFSMLFGVALTKLPDERRAPVIAFFRGVADAMLVMVRWILFLAPLGVFALAVPLAARIGIAAAGALAYYVGAIAIVCLALIAVCTIVAVTLGRVPLRAFLKTAAPAQAVAFSSRSSLASLPALIEGAEAQRHPKALIAFFLPLAVATFRLGAVPALLVGSMFLGRLYGVSLDSMQMIGIVLTAILLSFSIPGVPGGSILIMAPVLANAGIPAEGIGILLALDTVPDMFRTMTNVTGDFTAISLLARFSDTAGKSTALETDQADQADSLRIGALHP